MDTLEADTLNILPDPTALVAGTTIASGLRVAEHGSIVAFGPLIMSDLLTITSSAQVPAGTVNVCPSIVGPAVIAWVMVGVLVVAALVAAVWLVIRNSLVRVPMGQLGLLVVRGRSTDTSLLPGLHWVTALRQRQVVCYPVVELSYRASSDPVVNSRPRPADRR